ncbi:MAG: tRNA 2-thiouridine(34) synthase MnmA [Planctomycetota bacterium]
MFRTQFDPSERLVVAMSGGVDSTVVAWGLAQSGHPLVGMFMRNGVHVDEAEAAKKSCCSLGDARDARMVAAKLGIPFQAVDLAGEFGGIIAHFVAEYGRGRTPNPCAVCNRDLKMGKLLEFADELGAAGVATGHYARIAVEDGRAVVRRGVDTRKDQSYQLFAVPERHLARTATPLGDLEKPRVRELAREAGLRTSAKPDSQEVCFIPSNDYRKLLAERGVTLHPGDLVDVFGNKLGAHPGTEHFTIGQRRGLGVATGVPMFVVELHPEDGLVVLGTAEDCKAVSLVASDLNWIGFDAPKGRAFRAEVQYRYHCTPAPATITVQDGAAEVAFDEPQLAVAPGQGAAFYVGDRLIGGGWIERATRQGATSEPAGRPAVAPDSAPVPSVERGGHDAAR